MYNNGTETYTSARFICDEYTILAGASSTEAYCNTDGTWSYNFQHPPKCVDIPKMVLEKINEVEKAFIEEATKILENCRYILYVCRNRHDPVLKILLAFVSAVVQHPHKPYINFTYGTDLVQ